jgi:hypothetical protein
MPVEFNVSIWKNWSKDLLDTAGANESRDQGYVFIYYGTFCYNDAFKRPHFTDFCYMFHGKSMTAEDAEACLGRNDSD